MTDTELSPAPTDQLVPEPTDHTATQLRRLRLHVYVLAAFIAGLVVFTVLLTVLIVEETAALDRLQNPSPPNRPAASAVSVGPHATPRTTSATQP
jgi:hypothetical protein